MTRNHSTVHSRSGNGARMKTSRPSYRKPFTGKIKFAPTRSAFRFHQLHSVRHFPAQIFVSRLNFAFEGDCHFSICPPPPGYVILLLLFCALLGLLASLGPLQNTNELRRPRKSKN